MHEHRIKGLRLRLGLSQERFARLVGVSLQTVRRWETGISRPLPIISLRLHQLLGEAEAPERRGGEPVRGRGRQPRQGIEVEIGLGGLFKGVSGLLDLVSKMLEEGREEVTRVGEKEVLGGKGKAVYGFSIRVGLGGKPVIESFGNVRATEAGPVVTEVREPLVDVFDEGDTVRVVAELAGVEEKDIRVEVKDDILTLTAEARDRKYSKEVLLPSPAHPQVQERSYRNGILELKLKKRGP